MGYLISRLLITLFTVLLLAGAGGYYTLFHTDVPFRRLEQKLVENGLDADGISGKINSNLHINRIQVGRADGANVVFEDVSLAYSGLRDLFVKRELRISELSIGQVTVKLPDETKTTVTSGKDEAGFSVARSERPPSLYPVSHYRAAQGIRLASVSRITASNVKLEHPALVEPLRLAAVTLVDLKSERDELGLSAFTVRSEHLDVDYAGTKLSGLIKGGLDFKLKEPVIFAGQFGWKGEKLTADMAALGGKVAFKTAPDDSGLLEINDLSLEELVDGAPPLAHLKLKLLVDNVNKPTLETLRVQPGEFSLGTSQFTVAPDNLVHGLLGEARRLKSDPQPYIEGKRKLGGLEATARLTLVPKRPGYLAIRLLSNPIIPDRELLAGVLYGQNFSKLNEARQKELATLQPGFLFQ